MPYRIDYDAAKKVRGLEKRTAGRPALAALLALGILLAFALRREGALRSVVIPGDAALTVAALEDLAGNLRAGQSIQSAMDIFCRQVSGLD